MNKLLKSNKSLAIALGDVNCELSMKQKQLDESYEYLNKMMFARSKLVEMHSSLKTFVSEFDQVLLLLKVDVSKQQTSGIPDRPCKNWTNQLSDLLEVSELDFPSEDEEMNDMDSNTEACPNNIPGVDSIPKEIDKQLDDTVIQNSRENATHENVALFENETPGTPKLNISPLEKIPHTFSSSLSTNTISVSKIKSNFSKKNYSSVPKEVRKTSKNPIDALHSQRSQSSKIPVKFFTSKMKAKKAFSSKETEVTNSNVNKRKTYVIKSAEDILSACGSSVISNENGLNSSKDLEGTMESNRIARNRKTFVVKPLDIHDSKTPEIIDINLDNNKKTDASVNMLKDNIVDCQNSNETVLKQISVADTKNQCDSQVNNEKSVYENDTSKNAQEMKRTVGKKKSSVETLPVEVVNPNKKSGSKESICKQNPKDVENIEFQQGTEMNNAKNSDTENFQDVEVGGRKSRKSVLRREIVGKASEKILNKLNLKTTSCESINVLTSETVDKNALNTTFEAAVIVPPVDSNNDISITKGNNEDLYLDVLAAGLETVKSIKKISNKLHQEKSGAVDNQDIAEVQNYNARKKTNIKLKEVQVKLINDIALCKPILNPSVLECDSIPCQSLDFANVESTEIESLKQQQAFNTQNQVFALDMGRESSGNKLSSDSSQGNSPVICTQTQGASQQDEDNMKENEYQNERVKFASGKKRSRKTGDSNLGNKKKSTAHKSIKRKVDTNNKDCTSDNISTNRDENKVEYSPRGHCRNTVVIIPDDICSDMENCKKSKKHRVKNKEQNFAPDNSCPSDDILSCKTTERNKSRQKKNKDTKVKNASKKIEVESSKTVACTTTGKNTFVVYAEVHPMPTHILNKENQKVQELQNLEVSVVLEDIFKSHNRVSNSHKDEEIIKPVLKSASSDNLPIAGSDREDHLRKLSTDGSEEPKINKRRRKAVSYKEPSLMKKLRQ